MLFHDCQIDAVTAGNVEELSVLRAEREEMRLHRQTL